MLITNGWCKIEGATIPKSDWNYGALTYLSNSNIYYGNVEVQITNLYSLSHGVRYKVIHLADTIAQIDAEYPSYVGAYLNPPEVIDGALFYSEPFTVSDSCVIKYGDATGSVLDKAVLILIDKYATPKLASISAQYNGESIKMGENFNTDDLVVTGVYTDGNTARILAGGYTLSSQAVPKLGSNEYTVTVTYGENVFSSKFVVIGIRNLIGITAKYDGKMIALGQSPERRNIIVTAFFSDESKSVVTDWTFPNGSVITTVNNGVIAIYYDGFSASITIPFYTETPSRLVAFYNGPNVEVGHKFLPSYVSVKLYYSTISGENNRYETLSGGYVFSTENITYEGNNIIKVSYVTPNGTLETSFSVYGFEPEQKLVYITGTYTGPPIAIGKPFNQEKIICKAFYSDNNVSTVKDFTVTNSIIEKVGNNDIIISYKGKSCIVSILGVEKETTSESGYNPVKISLNYPEATLMNHRFRGPMESKKVDAFSQFLYDNISDLYGIYGTLQKNFNAMADNFTKISNTGTTTLNECSRLTDGIEKWKNDERFYIK